MITDSDYALRGEIQNGRISLDIKQIRDGDYWLIHTSALNKCFTIKQNLDQLHGWFTTTFSYGLPSIDDIGDGALIWAANIYKSNKDDFMVLLNWIYSEFSFYNFGDESNRKIKTSVDDGNIKIPKSINQLVNGDYILTHVYNPYFKYMNNTYDINTWITQTFNYAPGQVGLQMNGIIGTVKKIYDNNKIGFIALINWILTYE